MAARIKGRATAKPARAKGAITDRPIDDYIEHSREFARPILSHQRALIHAACPGVEETLKWGRPTFVYRGRILCVMSAFKAHCALSFWQSEVAALIVRDGFGKAGDGAGQFGRISSLADLPDDATLRRYLAEAVRVLEAGKPVRAVTAAGVRRPPIPLPEDFAALLQAHPAAAATYEKFSPSHRREYLKWIVEAKRAETRAKRMAIAIEQLALGKSKEWKYRSARD